MIEVMAAGLHTSIQDLGRYGYRNLGVPVSGTMDQAAAFRANKLVGNPSDCAVIEFTASGPILSFEIDAVVAISGALFTPKVEGVSQKLNIPFRVKSGQVLSFDTPSAGIRGYLAVQGGIQTQEYLGSRSSYEGITPFGRLKKGMRLPIRALFDASVVSISSEVIRSNFDSMEVEVTKGPEYEALSESVRSMLVSGDYKVGVQSNRMAYVLEHAIEISAKEIITGPVQPGTVQLTPSGQLMVLMRDAQTTGGYARIFQLSERAINKLSQKRSGMAVRFQLVDFQNNDK